MADAPAPGIWAYLVFEGTRLIILLAGTKTRQRADIAPAREFRVDYKRRNKAKE